MRMLDLFAGELGWASVFAARGWKVTAVDLKRPQRKIPKGIEFWQEDVLRIICYGPNSLTIGNFSLDDFDFICASSPCEEFSVHGMKCFHPNPKYPDNGIKLFNHTRAICEESEVLYIMENVRAAEQFVGRAVHHCGPFYLWGNAVPPILPQGISKGMKLGGSVDFAALNIEERRKHRTKDLMVMAPSGSRERQEWTERVATIPPELANAVAEYAERLIEAKVSA